MQKLSKRWVKISVVVRVRGHDGVGGASLTFETDLKVGGDVHVRLWECFPKSGSRATEGSQSCGGETGGGWSGEEGGRGWTSVYPGPPSASLGCGGLWILLFVTISVCHMAQSVVFQQYHLISCRAKLKR